ncbi:MAG: iron ABC transporter permease [Verrucomicrobiota bacterium]
MPLRIKGARRLWVYVILIAVLFLAAGISLGTGAMKLSWGEVLSVLFEKLLGRENPELNVASSVIWQIRLPRIILAVLIGAGLAVSGAVLQGLFRNPLADPGLIGVSSGSAMGAVVAIVLFPAFGISSYFFDLALLPLMAMAGGVGVTFLVYQLSRVGGRIHVASMLLTGIAINAIAGALIGLCVTLVANDDQLRTVTFWTLGSLAGATWTSVGILLVILAPCLVVALRLGQALNAFLLGELEAYHLGVNVNRVKQLAIVVSALMVGVTVAFSGIIGFIGLVAPHIVRLSLGPDHRLLLPVSALSGGLLLLIADTFARTVAAPAELQIGILTALLGGPFFLLLLLGGRRQMTV